MIGILFLANRNAPRHPAPRRLTLCGLLIAGAMTAVSGCSTMEPVYDNVSDYRFEDLDTDRSGYIEVEEAGRAPEALAAWNGADINDDGLWDRAEFGYFARLRLMDMLDADYNGVLEPQEVAKRPALVARWLQLDRNQDDRLDATELERW